MKALGVFCGSSMGTNPIYAAIARELGRALAQRDISLVYGGGRIGLMGQVAMACLADGGRVIGVIPHLLSQKEIAFEEVTELILVDSMHERKALMAQRSDAFVALPGGYGTCDEFFEILTWAQLGIHNKPIALLNANGFFTPLLAWLDQLTADGFLKPKHRSRLLVCDTVPELLEALSNWTPSEPTTPADKIVGP